MTLLRTSATGTAPRRSRPRAAVAGLGMLALTLAGACGLMHPPRSIPVNAWFADDLDLAPVRRVMVLPFAQAEGIHAQEEEVRLQFFRELGKVQRFEVIPLPAGTDEHDDLADAARKGRVSLDALVRLGRRYNIDGVLLGTITSYRPYQPPHLGLRVQLVSLHTGSTVWAVDAVYDGVDKRVQEDLRHYYRTQLADERSMHGWELNMLSPRRFAAYVAYRLVRTWRRV